ncbi:MAG: GntR family transcriptional regulator [Clostridiales Family XIII bacterium]|jgi:DNA-binding GntR family transcriptional regulator|nr:GntR family transcriptional regulator [Clostridiales Family XIII bacterium]
MAQQIQKVADLADKIRIEILAEHISPGEKITEQSLADRFSVSRTPVRESFRLLESEGLIRIIPNRGAFVVGFSKADMIDLYRLRLLLETQAIEWAIQRRTDDEIDSLEESIDFMTFYTERGDIKRMRDINVDFHNKIVTASHNKGLIETLGRMHKYMRFSTHIRTYEEDNLEEILAEHTKLYRAFKKNSPSAGGRMMRTHIEHGLERSGLLG